MHILMPFLCEIPGFGPNQTGFYREFYDGITEALLDLGHTPIAFPFAKQEQRAPEEIQALYRILTESRVDAVLDLCCWGYGLSHFVLQKQNGESSPVYDMFDVPYVGMLLDHPYNQAIDGIIARRLYATYPDLGHSEQSRLAYPDLTLSGSAFAPPAVRERTGLSPHSGEERDIDVLYIGTLPVHALERFWHNPSNGYWRSWYDREVCDAIMEGALAAPERSFHRVVQDAMASVQERPPAFNLKEQMRAVEWHLRAQYRRDMVVALARAGVHLHVVGAGWDTVRLPANAVRIEGTDYGGMYRLAGNAKICLDVSTYLDGANDRVFAYASKGAVCFTNAAGYMRPQFDDAMHFYSLLQPDRLVEDVRALLPQTKRLLDEGGRARARVLASHTWRHRLGEIIAAVPPLRGKS